MTYTLQEQYNSKNQVPGPQADNVWHLGTRKVSSITIHHWGLNGQQFDTVRDFLCTNNTPTSAHYVAQDGLVACIVSPDNCAFHAGNAEGNTNSIGIECRPEATDGDYRTVAELIAFLRGIYGDIPLYPHNHWYNTACPGDYDLARLDSLARGTGISTQGSITTAEEIDVSAAEDILARITETVTWQDQQFQEIRATAESNRNALAGFTRDVVNGIPAAVLNQQFTLPDGTVTNLAGILAAIHAQPATVGTVTVSDPAAVVAAIRDQFNK